MSEFIIDPRHKMVLKPEYNQCQFLKGNWNIQQRCNSEHLKKVIMRINARKEILTKYGRRMIPNSNVFRDAEKLRSILEPGDISKYTGILFTDEHELILDPYY